MQILEVIKQHGYKQTDVANAMGVTRGFLSYSLNHSTPSIPTLRKIADVIGANMCEFFADELPPMPQPTTPEFADTITIMGKRYGLVPLDGD